MIWGEKTGKPGYSLYDRALGATYLNGMWEGSNERVKKKVTIFIVSSIYIVRIGITTRCLIFFYVI